MRRETDDIIVNVCIDVNLSESMEIFYSFEFIEKLLNSTTTWTVCF
jgi:hypothetical protein